MAHAFTQRVQAQAELQKVPILAWLAPIAAPIGAVLCHLVLVLIYLHAKPIPHIIVFWLPVIAGVIAGYGLFAAMTKSPLIGCPKWAAPLVVVLSLGLSLILPFVAQKNYELKVRRSLIQQVNAFVTIPYLPPETATCTVVSVPERSPAGGYTFRATLKRGSEHTLTAEVKLFQATMRYDSLVQALQCDLAESVMQEPLEACLSTYSHLKSLPIKEAEIASTPAEGSYDGHILFENSLELAISGGIEKKALVLKLEPDAHLRALAIPRATELWQQFDPESDETCLDVKLGDAAKNGVRLCDAVLTDGETIPVLIKEKPEAGPNEIDVYFQFREAAIVQINAELREIAELSGDTSPAVCVNVDRKEELRSGEFSLRAVFPEGDPLMVLARQEGNDVSIVAEEHVVMLAPSTRSAEKSWSMLVPAHYGSKESTEFVRAVLSEEDALQVSLESKPVSRQSKFDLREYTTNDRDEWGSSRPLADVSEVIEVETLSGLTGYGYTGRKTPALRIKYLFMKDGSLAVITALSTDESAGLEDKVKAILASLRFKDVAEEGDGD